MLTYARKNFTESFSGSRIRVLDLRVQIPVPLWILMRVGMYCALLNYDDF